MNNAERMRQRRADPAQREVLLLSQQRAHFRAKYGLELEQIETMWLLRNGCCDLCGVEKPAPHHKGHHAAHKLVVDHCHETNKVRGLLCYKCNTALGQLGDTDAALRRVIRYVGGAH